MSQSLQRTPSSRFRVFSACLLSFLLIMMPFVQVAVAAKRAAVRGQRSEDPKDRPAKKGANAAPENLFVKPALPEPVAAPLLPNITATLTDNRNPGTDPVMANPGDTITYTATISNTGTTDATGVTFNMNVDAHTTLTAVNTQPVTVPDTYTASGNIQISKAAPGVLTNDVDPDTGNNSGLTVSKVQGAALNVGVATDTTAVGRGAVKGSVTLNSNGSFTYEPPPGYVGGDSFTYEATDGSKTDTNTVTITISQMVWFIRNSGGGSNYGTFSNPFTSIASFNTANNVGGAAATPNPKDGDLISLRTGTGTYTEADGVNLRVQQKLIGEGIVFNTVFTADANSSSAYTTFAGAAGAPPNIVTTAGNGVDLLTDNTVRGLNVGNTPGFFKINGGAVGSPTIGTVDLTGTGGALNISTSGTFGANVSFGTFESTSSPGANLNLVGVTGTLGITSGGTGLSGSAVSSNAVNVSGGTVSFTYPGNVTKASLGALVNISGGHNTGTIIFQTGTLSATSGTGFQFNNADGTYNFNGTNTLNGGDAGIDVLNDSSGTFTFSAASTITSPTGTGFNVGSAPGAPNVTYSGSITYNTVSQSPVVINGTTGGTVSIATVNAGTTAGGVNSLGVNINNASGNVGFTTLNLGTAGTRMVNQAVTISGGSGTYNLGTVGIFTGSGAAGIVSLNADGAINSTGGTVDASNGTAISIDGPVGITTLGMTLGTVNSSGGTNNISLIDCGGSFTVNAGALSNASVASFSVNGGTVSATYSGGITQANNAAMVNISNGHSGGTILFQTGTLNASNGTGLQFNNADGTYNFTGTTTLAGGDAGIDITNGSAGTFAFGGTTITNPTGVGLNVDGGLAAITGPISISGTISKTSAGRLIDFSNYDTATATISGTLTCNTACDGIEVTNDGTSSGTVNFTSGTKTLNTVADTAVNLDNNDGGAINFTGGGLDIDTTTGNGFVATNGGTVTIQGSTNSVNSTTGTNVNITDTTIGAGNVTFERIDHNGNNTAIILDDTGSGTFTVNGSGTTDGSGGTVENITASDAITLLNTDGLVTLKNMIIEDIGSTAGGFNTVSGHDGIHGQQVDGGLTLDNMFIRRISDNAVNGSTFAGGASTTWNGLNIVNGCVFENTNRFHVANVGDANNEGMVRILGLTGTVNVTDSTLQDGAEMLDLFPNTGTMTLTVTNNTFHRAYKEFTSGTTASVGGHCIDVTVQGSGNAVVNIGHRTNNALDNDFLNCRLGSIRVANDAGATGTVDVMIGQNEFTSNDHSSGITGDFDFPMGGVLIMSRGTNTAVFQVVLDSNYFDEITNASGGVGQFSLDMDGGQWEVIAEDNTFDTPGNAPWFIRADNAGNVGTMNSSILLQNNNYIRGAFCSPDPAAAGGGCNLGAGELCGGQGYCGPGLRSLVQVQNGANINFTLNSDDLKHHDTGFDPGNTVEVQQLNVPIGGNNGTVCTNFTNNTAADGYSLEHFNTAVGTFNLQKGASNTGPCTNCSVAQIQDVFDDNGNTGGGNNPATDPPTVSVPFLGVNVIAGTCTQPSIPFGPSDIFKSTNPPVETGPAPVTTVRDLELLEQLLEVAPPVDTESPDGVLQWKLRRRAYSPINQDEATANPGAPNASPIQWTVIPVFNMHSVTSDSSEKDELANQEKAREEKIKADEAKKQKALEDEIKAEEARLQQAREDEIKAEQARIEKANADKANAEKAEAEKAKDNNAPAAESVKQKEKSAQPPVNKTAKPASPARNEQPENQRHHATSDIKSQRTDSGQPPAVRNHVAAAARALASPLSGEPVGPIVIGTLVPGDSVTITFTATVNNPPNLTLLNPARVSVQGAVSGSNFATVMTDDPDVVGGPNATETLIDLFNVSVGVVAVPASPTDFGDAVTFTATLTETPVQAGADPTGTVQFLDGATPLTCTEGGVNGIRPVSGGTAACTTSALAQGAHTINANYSGDGNFDANTGNISHTVNACVSNPVVTKIADTDDGTCDADCSLREAIAKVCNGTTITFDTAGVFATAQTITLSASFGALTINKNLTIQGPGSTSQKVTVVGSGSATDRVFVVNASKTATIANLTITGGNANAIGGGGIKNDGTLTLKNVTVSGNATTQNGAGIHNSSVLNIVNSTISGNTATIDGGGIVQDGATPVLTMINTTVSGNTANGYAGGLDLRNGTATIINSTITGNHGDNDDGSGGGAGGIRQQSATVTLHNTIVAGNYSGSGTTTPNDIEGTVTGSNNLIGDAATAGGLTHGTNGNIVGNAGTGTIAIATVLNTTLANNGGLTQTHALVSSGPAVEAGSNANLPTDTFDLDGDANTAETLPVDQRGTGFPRVADSADVDTTATVDIGAYELHPSIEDITDKNTNEDTLLSFSFNLGDGTGALIATVGATSSNQTLIPDANINFTGSGSSRTINITPAADRNSTIDGTATITVTVTATNGQTAVDTFVVTVDAINDPPSFTLAGNPPAVNESSGPQSVPSFATSISQGPNETGQVLTFNVSPVSSTGSLTFSTAPAINSTTGELTYTATDGTDGTATFSVTLSDDGSNVSPNSNTSAAQQFTITVNDVPLTLGGTVWNDNGAGGGTIGNGLKEGTEPSVDGVAVSLFVDADNNDAPDTPGTPLATGTTAGGGNYSFTNLSPGNYIVRIDVDNFDAGGNVSLLNLQLSSITIPEPPDPDNNLDNDDNGSRVPLQAAFSLAITLSHNNEPTAGLGNNTNNTLDFGFFGNPPPSINNLGGDTSTFTEDGPAVALDVSTAATVTDDQTNFNGGNLTVSTTVNEVAAEDVLAISTSGSVSLSAGMTVGSIVSVGGNPIGAITANGTGGNDLVVTFTTTDATPANVGTLIQALTYSNSNTSNPSTLQRTIAVSVNDGLGGTDSENVFVNVVGVPDISVHDAKVAEPASGSANMVFTVSLDAPATGPVSVNFTTADEPAGPGKAVASQDYTPTNGTVNFTAGQQVRTINVPVLADATPGEPDETFLVNLSGATNGTILDGTATGTITAANPAGTFIISEIRTSGPGGLGDDFVELYNNTGSSLTVAATDASAGYGVFKMGADCDGTPVLIGTIPNGTVIPAGGHYLLVGSQYSLGNYGGSGAAAGNLTMSSDIDSDRNVGVFSTSDVVNLTSINRLDAVGFGINVNSVCDLLREGSTLGPASGSTLEHTYFRKECDFVGGCTTPGTPKDTNANLTDFMFADTQGTLIVGTGQRLGAPGPQNMASPIKRDTSGISLVFLDSTKPTSAVPNRSRNLTPGNPMFAANGTITVRRRVVNNTGGDVTRLRYRIVELTTFPSPGGGVADLRALTSTLEAGVGPVNDPATCTASGAGSPPCNVTVQLTTLETPPNQSLGGGYNSTLSSGTITMGSPLANGASINVNFLLGVQTPGTFRFLIIVEALP